MNEANSFTVVDSSAPEVTSAVEPIEATDAAQSEVAQTEPEIPTEGSIDNPSTVTAETAPTVDTKTFTLNLAGTDVDDEIAKRKARAERFKLASQPAPAPEAEAEAPEQATADSEALKTLERAQRFGTGSSAVSKLDEALPSEDPRGRRGRKHRGDETNGNRRGRFDKGRRGGGPGRPTGVSKPGTTFGNQADKDAAEARKKRFAAAT